jgi:predicted enzyme related to lactoylglutathione lyase
MPDTPQPSSTNGIICYLEIPAADPERSAQFYHDVFGWKLRKHDDGTLAFDDNPGGTRQVSGMWVTGRPPMSEAGIIISIMVDDAEKAVASVVAHGGEIVRPLGFNPHERIAWFRDPGGNVMGIYQEP